MHRKVMKAVQSTHPPHHHNGFCGDSGGVHAWLVLEPTWCSTSTNQGA